MNTDPSAELGVLREQLDDWSRDMVALVARLLAEDGLTWEQCLARSRDVGEEGTPEAVIRIFQRGLSGLHTETLKKQVAAFDYLSEPVARICDSVRNVEVVLYFFDRDDERVKSLIARRFGLVEQIAVIKRDHQLSLHNRDREREVMAYAATWCTKCGLPEDLGPALYRCLWFPLAYEIETMVLSQSGTKNKRRS